MKIDELVYMGGWIFSRPLWFKKKIYSKPIYNNPYTCLYFTGLASERIILKL